MVLIRSVNIPATGVRVGVGCMTFVWCELLVFWLNKVIFNLSQQVLHNIVDRSSSNCLEKYLVVGVYN